MKNIAKDKFYKKIKETGLSYVGDEPLYYQLVVGEYELDELMYKHGSLDNISRQYDVDFISVIIKSEIDFIHLTDIRNKSGIEKLGLIIPDSEDVPDLGKGVYVIDNYSERGFYNLKEFVAQKDANEILVIEGTYKGGLEVCVYGDGHEGYVVLNDNVAPENLEMRVMSVKDFLTSDISEFQYN